MEQRNWIFAVVLSLLVFVGWSYFFPPPPPVEQATPVEDIVDQPRSRQEERSPEPRDPVQEDEFVPLEGGSEVPVVLEAPQFAAEFSSRGGQLSSLRLLGIVNSEGDTVEMVRDQASGPGPFALVSPTGESLPINDRLFVVEASTKSSVRFVYRGRDGQVTKQFTVAENGFIDVEISARGIGAWTVMLGPGLRNPIAEELSGRGQTRGASWRQAGDIELLPAAKAIEIVQMSGEGVQWVGLEDTYFLAILAPVSPIRSFIAEPVLPSGPADAVEWVPAALAMVPEDVDVAEVRDYRVLLEPYGDDFHASAYFGSKRYEKLRTNQGDLGLTDTVRWSGIDALARMMLIGLLWIHDNAIANFGWSIVLLTVVIKLLLLPLTHKSMTSMERMKELQPQMDAIKAKYRGKQKDKQGRPNMEAQRKQNEEIQALFKEQGVNPIGGCLPMILQMPFFFAMFALLGNSVELWNAPWILWITDLSAKDPYYVLPLVMGVLQFVQTRMTPTPNSNPSQKMMMNMMPIMFTFISFGFASGLVLYWLTQSAITIVQTAVYHRLKTSGHLGGQKPSADSTGGVTKKLGAAKKRPSQGK